MGKVPLRELGLNLEDRALRYLLESDDNRTFDVKSEEVQRNAGKKQILRLTLVSTALGLEEEITAEYNLTSRGTSLRVLC
ncbi:MAG: hypothetical protein GX335_10425 [Firmicutes bacterium]|nr:hypothetical protein [Bacillota bacterium]